MSREIDKNSVLITNREIYDLLIEVRDNVGSMASHEPRIKRLEKVVITLCLLAAGVLGETAVGLFARI